MNDESAIQHIQHMMNKHEFRSIGFTRCSDGTHIASIFAGDDMQGATGKGPTLAVAFNTALVKLEERL